MKRTFFYNLYTWLRRICDEVGDMKQSQAESEGFYFSDYLLLLRLRNHVISLHLADVAPGLGLTL